MATLLRTDSRRNIPGPVEPRTAGALLLQYLGGRWGCLQLVAARSGVVLDVQTTTCGADGHARPQHATVALSVQEAHRLLVKLQDVVTQAVGALRARRVHVEYTTAVVGSVPRRGDDAPYQRPGATAAVGSMTDAPTPRTARRKPQARCAGPGWSEPSPDVAVDGGLPAARVNAPSLRRWSAGREDRQGLVLRRSIKAPCRCIWDGPQNVMTGVDLLFFAGGIGRALGTAVVAGVSLPTTLAGGGA